MCIKTNKKELYETAIITSPIIALFECSVIALLTHQTVARFLVGVIVITILSLFIWLINIFVLNIENTTGAKTSWKRYTLSYMFLLIFFAFASITTDIISNESHTTPSVILQLTNILSLNAIVLIMVNNMIMRSQKSQTESELANLKIKHLEAEHQQLIQQLQPHFLFNSFSTLKSIIGTDTELAQEYLVKLSNFLRFTATAHQNTIIPLCEELEFTKNYIDLQQIRFEDALYYKISIPDNMISQFEIPVYALQSLVENAIKHNAFNNENTLKIDIVFDNGNLIVSNNKLPKPPGETKSGIGLNNLKKRYKLSTGQEINIEESSMNFRVTLKLISKRYD
ncbi:hypothetical protein GM418_30050 [Maribellus comscasis]|uniref:Signal transduction histidine kinase internal region domain-containing protein n=1 Tax=Maribellus comscasis TaxID=2681766 RepID=A0A6I6KBW5_9BACT|nr:histidine kinase [Maribellus comscasis]QGY47754.1 hypothetical protein GM418_30050 [Maribellus comscasis]